MKINNTLYDFEFLCYNKTYADVFYLTKVLTSVKAMMESYKEELLHYTMVFNENVELITDIEKQLKIIDVNLETLLESLLIHEDKTLFFEPNLESLSTIWLN